MDRAFGKRWQRQTRPEGRPIDLQELATVGSVALALGAVLFVAVLIQENAAPLISLALVGLAITLEALGHPVATPILLLLILITLWAKRMH